MAKKTNKTDHVLNLLAGVKPPEQEEDKEADRTQPVSALPAPEAGQPVQKISVIHTSSSEKDPIAETIRGALEKQAEIMENGGDLEEEQTEEEEKAPEEIPPMEPLPEEILARAASEKEEAVTGQKEEPAEKQAQETVPKYVFYNVMETLIRDKVLDYMNKFGICTCDRCVTDTTALALNHVPPKYVVVDREAVSPLKNYYERAFVGEITVALSQACIVVGGNPYHDR